MARDPDRITWLALLIVDEAAKQAAAGPVPPTLGLRLALAFLCSIADGPIYGRASRRDVFDQFWREATRPAGGGNPHTDAYARRATIASCQEQIGRQLGLGESIFNAVREARSPEARARARLADAIRRANDDRARQRWRKREGYFGRRYPGDDPRRDR